MGTGYTTIMYDAEEIEDALGDIATRGPVMFHLNNLQSDAYMEVAQRYGVWREKTTFGNTYEGIVRSTFLIDEGGTLVDIQDNVQAKGHVERLLRDLPE